MEQGVSLAPPSLPPPSIENLRNHVFPGDGNKENKMSSCNVYELFEHFRSHYLTVSMYDRVRPFSFVLNLSSNLSLKLRTSNIHHISESKIFLLRYEIQITDDNTT